MSVVSLDQLKIGQSGKVIKIEGSTEQLRRRLIDMGIISGTQILMCKRAPMGDPIEI
ncbi:MAG: ferrous iron transport protein A, partial [Clostridia bacterium]|nr:ferrous iron transport protein A [Clostridia bacterium]